MSKTSLDQNTLEALFAEDASGEFQPSLDFLARVEADAERIQEGFLDERAPVKRERFWQVLVASIGGWRAVAGLATATVVGVWIGINPPSSFETLTEVAWVNDTATYSEYLPLLELDLSEGQL